MKFYIENWDSQKKQYVTTKDVRSAELSLGHELGHAIAFDENMYAWDIRSKIKIPGWDNLEELLNIVIFENPAAETLGEKKRYNHGGIKLKCSDD